MPFDALYADIKAASGVLAGNVVLSHAKILSLASAIRPAGPYVISSQHDLYWAPKISEANKSAFETRRVTPKLA